MDTSELIDMLNRDLKDEHAATLRYLVHSYTEGEDTPIGAGLLSRSREEMWHMHWLGMIIGHLGGEPDLIPAEYPYDPASRASIFKSYVAYEENLIPHYNAEAERVTDPHIRRVLQREAWESAIHARKFQRVLDKLSAEEASGLPGGEREMPEEFLGTLQREVADKYAEMLQHVRHAWVFQDRSVRSWQLMDQAMEKMKQLAHFAEDVAENGLTPDLTARDVDTSSDFGKAVQASLYRLQQALERHRGLSSNEEARKHGGFVINLDLTLQQEEYQEAEMIDWLERK
jgi:bacterioferritin